MSESDRAYFYKKWQELEVENAALAAELAAVRGANEDWQNSCIQLRAELAERDKAVKTLANTLKSMLCELAEKEKEAKRYQYLRGHPFLLERFQDRGGMDAAIDAAIDKQEG